MADLEKDPFIIEKQRFRSRQLKEFVAMVGGAATAGVGVVAGIEAITAVGIIIETGSVVSMFENCLRHDRTIDSLNIQSVEKEVVA